MASVAAAPAAPGTSSSGAALEARNLYKIFGSKPEQLLRRLDAGEDVASATDSWRGTAAVIDASFTVQPGEIFVVMGLSGSGKSTLIRMLNGLHEPTRGEVLVHGQDISKMAPADLRRTRREHISMVFQHFALFPHRTVAENAAYGLQIRGVPGAERRRKALEALELVGLSGWADHRPKELSGGMQQRVGLARALAADTDVLLMDEAFSALDPLIRRDMQDQLGQLQSQLSKTIVFITHDLNEAMRLGDRVAMMREGRIVQIGTAAEILANPADDYVTRFIADVDRSRVLTARAIMDPAPAATQVDSSIAVPPTMLAADLLPHAARSTAPLQVIEDGQLIGLVSRERLLTEVSHVSETQPAAANEEVTR